MTEVGDLVQPKEPIKIPHGTHLEMESKGHRAVMIISNLGAGVINFEVDGESVLKPGSERGVTAKGDTGKKMPAAFLAAPFGRSYDIPEFVQRFLAFGRIEEELPDGTVKFIQPGIPHGPTNTTYSWSSEGATPTSSTRSVRTNTPYLSGVFNSSDYSIQRNFQLVEGVDSPHGQITTRITYNGENGSSKFTDGVFLPMAEHAQVAINKDEEKHPCIITFKRNEQGEIVGYNILDIHENIRYDQQRNDHRLDHVFKRNEIEIEDGVVLVMPNGLEDGKVIVLSHSVKTNISDLPRDVVVFGLEDSGSVSIEERFGSYKPLRHIKPGDYIETRVDIESTTLSDFASRKGILLPENPVRGKIVVNK